MSLGRDSNHSLPELQSVEECFQSVSENLPAWMGGGGGEGGGGCVGAHFLKFCYSLLSLSSALCEKYQLV